MSDNINSIGIEDYENKYGILGNTEKKSLDNFMNVEDAFRYETNSDKIKNILETCRNYNVCQGFTPISQALPFAKPYDFEANRVNLPTPQKMGNINNNNYKPNPATITILEDENRERNSWGFNSMIAGASLIGAGALAYNTYRNMRNKKIIDNPEMPELTNTQAQAQNIIMREAGGDMNTKSQILIPPDSPPDRGLVSNPLEARTEARGIINEVLARTFTTLDNKNRKQPRKNEFAGVPEFGGNIPPSKDLIRNRKYFDNL
tara:strand:- start:5616 stop:6398 length:783 start_codon:yes stop_codon:yes gene_type:complete